MNWIDRVRAGDFSAIPTDINFESSATLAHLIDGYDLTGGASRCAEITHRIADEIQNSGETTASALDLWIALFGQHRAHRHCGYPPSIDELPALDHLVQSLRVRLLKLTAKQKAGIMSVVLREASYGSSWS